MQQNTNKIRRRIFLFIATIVFTALGLFVFAACSDDLTIDVLKERGFSVTVTYDFSGGTVNSQTGRVVLVEPNSKLPAPRVSVGAIGVPFKEGYSFRGFFVAETDADGNVVKDSDGNISVSDTQWNFETDRVKNEDITLCAQWWKNYTLVLRYGPEYGLSKEVNIAREADGTAKGIYESVLDIDDYTVLSRNLIKDSSDAETAVNSFPYVVPQSAFNGGTTAEVWCEALAGNYILVRDASDLSLSSVAEDTNYYLLNDIDFDGALYDDQQSSVKIPKVYKGNFVGNNHTVSNFTLKMSVLDKTYDSFGLFRKLEGASITDVTFKDVTLSYDISDSSVSRYYAGMLAGRCDDKTVIKNVKFDSSAPNKSTFECLIGLDVSNYIISVPDDLLIADRPQSVDVADCAVANINRVLSTAVLTADTENMLFVKYSLEENGEIVFGEDAVYKLATKSKKGTYSYKTIDKCEYAGENKYVITRLDGSVYDVVLSVDANQISATMTMR